jgi:tetratricopeptide (TPR) repeat protein
MTARTRYRSATCKGAIALFVFLAFVTGSPWAASPTISRAEAMKRFEHANQLYQNRNFKEALAEYKSLIDAGIQDPVLYYNAGNAYVQLGRKGWAVVMYERARRLAPRDAQIRANLAYVRSAQPPQAFILWRPFVYLRDLFTLNEWLIILEGFVLWIAIAAACFFLVRRESVRTPARYFLVGGIVFGLIAAGFVPWRGYVERGRRLGVIVAEKAISRYGPSTTMGEHLSLAEGTRVRILDEPAPGWLVIQPIDVPNASADRTYVAKDVVQEI